MAGGGWRRRWRSRPLANELSVAGECVAGGPSGVVDARARAGCTLDVDLALHRAAVGRVVAAEQILNARGRRQQ